MFISKPSLRSIRLLASVLCFTLCALCILARPFRLSAPSPNPTRLSPADHTALLLANYSGSLDHSNKPVLTNESRLKITPNPSGPGFVPQPSDLAQIERDAFEKLAKPGWHPIRPEKYVRPIFPEHFTDSVTVTSQNYQVRAVPSGASAASTATIANDGSLIYANAFPGCDVAYRASALKAEEFIVLRDSNAQTTWSWELDCANALKPRLTPSNNLELVDKNGVPRMRINAPEGKDADGTPLRVGNRLKITLEGSKITVAAATEGLKFPIVIDPSFSSTGAMSTFRAYQTADLMNDNTVLVTGGTSGSNYLNTCEIYDRATATWSDAPSMSIIRLQHQSVLLNNGNVLVIAGDQQQNTFEIYDPVAKAWQPPGSLNLPHVNFSVTKLVNGDVLATGGNSTTQCELFSAATGLFSLTGTMLNVHAYAPTVLLPNGNVLISGGRVITSGSASCEIFDAISHTWSATGPMNNARTEHDMSVLPNGDVLASNSIETQTTELYSPATGSWALNSSIPSAFGHPKLFKATNNAPVCFNAYDVNIYDAPTNTWKLIASRQVTAFNGSTTDLHNGTILAAGGLSSACEILSFTPDAVPAVLTTHIGQPIDIGLTGNAIFQPISYSLVSTTANGQLTGTPPSLHYVSNPGFVGTDSFTFKVNDGMHDSTPGTISIKVTDTAPIASAENYSAHSGIALQLTLHGRDLDSDPLTFVPVTPPSHGTLTGTPPSLTYTPAPDYIGLDSFTFKANDNALDSVAATISINVTDTTPVATAETYSTHINTALQLTLDALDADGNVLTYATIALPNHGTLSGTPPSLTYTPAAGYLGTDSFTFKANDGALDSNVSTITINVTNSAPNCIASASPTTVLPGQSVSFNATGNDVDGDTFTYAWDFGDASNAAGANPAHSYSASGTYTAILTATDSFGATGTSSVVITVFDASAAPNARFTTSEVVAFVGTPFTFDASFSTDPDNNIVSYSWGFGDGSPDGKGQVISKIYKQAGVVTASLTIVDGNGLIDTQTREIQVLPADQIGLFNSNITYNLKWDRSKTNTDTLTLSAVLNVGDVIVGAGSPVALTVPGQRFEGTLDGKLRDFSDPDMKWQIKANIRGKPFGEVTLKVQIKHASFGLGFNQAGVLQGVDIHDTVTTDIPIHLEIAGRTFDVPISTDFKFRKSGLTATGKGDGPN